MINKKLDKYMWDEDNIALSWIYDPDCLTNLIRKKNVVEFMDRSTANRVLVMGIISNIDSVLNEHELKIVNHFPSGVGGLTFSVLDKHNNRAVLKFYGNNQQLTKALEATRLLYKIRLGPRVLFAGKNLLVFEAVVPGIPIRSAEVNLDIIKNLILDLNRMSTAHNLSQDDDTHEWYRKLQESLVELSVKFKETEDMISCLELIKDREVGFSHGDAQLGNILIAEKGYKWIDPEPELAPKEADLARLYTHTCADLIANDSSYDTDALYNLFITDKNVDKKTFLTIGCIKAFVAYSSLGFGSTRRDWEAKAYYSIYKDLLSKLETE